MGKRDTKPMVDESDPNWLRFWNNYPRRVAKKDARIAWAQINPSTANVDCMIETLSWQIESEAWTRDGGRFIPYPASYLRAERWCDEPPVKPADPVMSDAAAMVFQTLGVKP